MLEAVEFAKWWEACQLEIWRATLFEGEKNRPMPAVGRPPSRAITTTAEKGAPA